MIFLHPLALLGLAAAAIPALLHLLERRDPPELEFPPLRYLSDAERHSARRLKLRHLLLLILRTAIIVAIVLAAARPLIPAAALGDSLAREAHEPTALVVVLDNSPSSGAVVDGHPLLDRLRVTAAGSLGRATASDRVWLMLADGVARAGSGDALRAIVDSVRPAATRLDLGVAVTRAARLADAEPLAAREVHVLSDLQRTALDGQAEVPADVRVLALAPAAEPPQNRGLAARVTDGALELVVSGTPGAPAVAVAARLRRDGREVGRALAAPGDRVVLALPRLAPGWWVGEAELHADELRADDRRLFAWRVVPPAGVTAAPEAGPFVAAALDVLRDGGRAAVGTDVVIGDRPVGGPSIVVPPADVALLGGTNRALAVRGARWRFAAAGPPGPLSTTALPRIDGIQVSRRYRLDRVGPPDGGDVLARVHDEPWLVRDGNLVLVASRLDTAWTALPTTPAFVPFLDALVNRVARGEAAVSEVEGPVAVTFETRGRDTVGARVSGPDPRESDLAPARVDAVRRALRAAVLDDAAFARERFAATRRADASGWLLALALALAALELAVVTRTR